MDQLESNDDERFTARQKLLSALRENPIVTGPNEPLERLINYANDVEIAIWKQSQEEPLRSNNVYPLGPDAQPQTTYTYLINSVIRTWQDRQKTQQRPPSPPASSSSTCNLSTDSNLDHPISSSPDIIPARSSVESVKQTVGEASSKTIQVQQPTSSVHTMWLKFNAARDAKGEPTLSLDRFIVELEKRKQRKQMQRMPKYQPKTPIISSVLRAVASPQSTEEAFASQHQQEQQTSYSTNHNNPTMHLSNISSSDSCGNGNSTSKSTSTSNLNQPASTTQPKRTATAHRSFRSRSNSSQTPKALREITVADRARLETEYVQYKLKDLLTRLDYLKQSVVVLQCDPTKKSKAIRLKLICDALEGCVDAPHKASITRRQLDIMIEELRALTLEGTEVLRSHARQLPDWPLPKIDLATARTYVTSGRRRLVGKPANEAELRKIMDISVAHFGTTFAQLEYLVDLFSPQFVRPTPQKIDRRCQSLTHSAEKSLSYQQLQRSSSDSHLQDGQSSFSQFSSTSFDIYPSFPSSLSPEFVTPSPSVMSDLSPTNDGLCHLFDEPELPEFACFATSKRRRMDESDVSHAELSTVVSEDAELDGLWDFLTNGNDKTGAGNASLGDEFVNWENGDDGGAAFDAFVQSLTSNEPIVTSTARCGIQEEVDKIKEVYHVQSEILELQNMGDESETVIVTLNGFAEMCLLERVVFTITDRARYEKLALKSVQNVEEVEPGIVGVAVTWKECSGKESTCSLDSRWMTDILHSLVELPV